LVVAEDNAPIVFLHENDQYGPSSVKWYLNRVELRYGKPSNRDSQTGQTELIVAKGMLNSNSVVGQNNSGDPQKPFCDKIKEAERSDFFLDIPDDSEEEITQKGDLANAPCYCHITKSVETNKWYINYLFFYPYNADIIDKDHLFTATIPPGSDTISLLSPYALGSHEGDWEYFAIEYDDDDNEIESVFYSAHASEGKWYGKGKFPIDATRNHRPKVYVANKSHANYTDIGSHKRSIKIGGKSIETDIIPADETSDQGPQWDCKNRLKFLHQTKPKWLNFNGRWGRFDDPDWLRFGQPPFGPATKGYWGTPIATPTGNP